MGKTNVIYDGHNPNQAGVTHVAIQSDASKPYVYCVYSVRNDNDLPRLPPDMPIIPIVAARNLFEFREGKIADISRLFKDLGK